MKTVNLSDNEPIEFNIKGETFIFNIPDMEVQIRAQKAGFALLRVQAESTSISKKLQDMPADDSYATVFDKATGVLDSLLAVKKEVEKEQLELIEKVLSDNGYNVKKYIGLFEAKHLSEILNAFNDSGKKKAVEK